MGYEGNGSGGAVGVGVPTSEFDAYKADNASQLATKAPQTSLDTQKARIDNLVATPNSSFYQKSTLGITGALLVVASGATTGQINLASVTPLATGYTAVAGDYVLLVYGVASGSAELMDGRIGGDGVTYTSVGNAIRGQFKKADIETKLTAPYYLYDSTATKSGSTISSNSYAYNLAEDIVGGYGQIEVDLSSASAVSLICLFKRTGTTSGECLSVVSNSENAIFDLTAYYTTDKFFIVVCGVVDYSTTKPSGTLNTSWYALNAFNTVSSFIVGDEYTYYPQGSVVCNFKASINIVRYIFNEIVSNEQPKIANKSTLTVAKDGSGDFGNINDAVTFAKGYATLDFPVTIFVKSGTYNEVANILGKQYISLVGENRNTCILTYGSGKYWETPLRVDGDALIKNLTIKGTMDDAGSWLPLDGTDVSKFGCYAIHVDDDHNIDGTMHTLRIENCTLYSEAHSAVGLGLHENQFVILENCDLESNISDNVYASAPVRSTYGALYAHSALSDTAPNQNLIIKSCTIHTNRSCAVRFEFHWYNVNNNAVKYGLYNNCVYDDVNGVSSGVYYIDTNTIATKLSNSYGNNISAMNA